MCNFTNRLFVFALLCVVCSEVYPYENDDLEYYDKILTPGKNYELHFDQRQKGEENLRIKLQGMFVAFPAPDSSQLSLLSDILTQSFGEELLLGLLQSKRSTTKTVPNTNKSNYYQIGAFHQKGLDESSKSDKILVEIPALKKDIESKYRIDSKAAGSIKASRSKMNGPILGYLLKAHKLRELSILDKKAKNYFFA